MSGAVHDPCELLKWDTDFFGFRIARVRGDSLSEALVKGIDSWYRKEKVRCLYFLSRADDPETTRLAEDNGFRMVDIRVTLRYKAGEESDERRVGHTSAATIRPARPEDLPSMKRLSGDIFHDTRFYFDPNFPRPLCDSLYEAWLERSCRGYADAVLVAELEGSPVGFSTCHLDGETGTGRIGITAVDRNFQGRGIGSQLIQSTLDWYSERGVTEIFTVVQGRNVATLHFDQRCGFLVHAVQIWYHKWFDV